MDETKAWFSFNLKKAKVSSDHDFNLHNTTRDIDPKISADFHLF